MKTEIENQKDSKKGSQASGALLPGYILNEKGEMIPDYENTFIDDFEEGGIVKGIVVSIDRDEVLVDIGFKSEGVIPNKELTIRGGSKASKAINIGDEIEVQVLEKEDKDGRLVLSKKRADYEKAWERLADILKNDETVKGYVIEAVKGGLILDIGVKGFLPASLIDFKKSKELDQFIGQEFECKILEMERSRNNVVLSRKHVLEKERRFDREAIILDYKVGSVVKGKISSVVDFGAFVDLGNIDGLIHISELSYDHVSHPSEVVSIGDEIEVKVIDVDAVKQRISLGLKQMQPDPWLERIKGLETGSSVTGKVTRLMPFGALVNIAQGVDALIHISEFTDVPNDNVSKYVKVGDELTAKIGEIDTENKRRIALTMRERPQRSADKASSSDSVASAPLAASESSSDSVTASDSDIAAIKDADEPMTAAGRLKKKKASEKEQEVASTETSSVETTGASSDTEILNDEVSVADSTAEGSADEQSMAASGVESTEAETSGDDSLEGILADMKDKRNTD